MNRHVQESRERVHQRTWELLPWLANDTLAGSERATVEQHVGECGDCRAELERCRALREGLRTAAAPAPAPHPRQLEQLLSRIDENERAAPDERGARAPWRAAWRATPAPARVALLGQLAAMLILALALLRAERAPAPPYRTLSDRPAPSAAAPGLPRLRLVFAPRTPEEEMRRLLLEIRGRLVAGPSPLGAYTVELQAGADPLSVVLTHLRGEAAVSLAEPVAIEER